MASPEGSVQKDFYLRGCPECKQPGARLNVAGNRRDVGGLLFRTHRCTNCGTTLLSVQMLVSPRQLLDLGISPLITSGRTPFPEATPAARRAAAAG